MRKLHRFQIRAYPCQHDHEKGWTRTAIMIGQAPPSTTISASHPDDLDEMVNRWAKTLPLIGFTPSTITGETDQNAWTVSVSPEGRWPAGFKARFSRQLTVDVVS